MRGAGDLQGGRVLKEDNGAEVVASPLRVELEFRAGLKPAGGGGADLAHLADHRGVAQQAAVVFALSNLRAQVRFSDGEKNIAWMRAGAGDGYFHVICSCGDWVCFRFLHPAAHLCN